MRAYLIRISNRLYNIVLNIRNVDRMEQQGVNSVVPLRVKAKGVNCNNSYGRYRRYANIN